MPRYHFMNGFEAGAYLHRDERKLKPSYKRRCPACGSANISVQVALVDERHTFALSPEKSHPQRQGKIYPYQEYRSLSCDSCGFHWHTEPTGRWSTQHDRYTGEPYDPRPCLVVDENRVPVREAQDFRRASQIASGRFSDVALDSALTHAPVCVFTGAGASVPFGFPSATQFQLPDWGQVDLHTLLLEDMPGHGTLTAFLDQAVNGSERLSLADRAARDVEVLMEVLLRLQDLIVQEGGDTGFESIRGDLGRALASWFIFGNFLSDSDYAVPPLTTMLWSKEAHSMIGSSTYFRMVRGLLEWLCRELFTRCSVPTTQGLELAKHTLGPFLSHLRSITGGPLAIFTTNYDLSLEYVLGDVLVDGFDYSRPVTSVYYERDGTGVPLPRIMFRPEVWLGCSTYALFHLHGAANYFVDPRTADCFCVDSNPRLVQNMHQLAWQSELPLLLGGIAPATCKDRYLYAPYFGVPYDYLAECLHHARVCVMIGYSCRDDVVKQFIVRSLATNDSLRFVVIGKGTPSTHFLDAVPPDRFAYRDTGFDESSALWAAQEAANLVG